MTPQINIVWMLHRRTVLVDTVLRIFSLCDTSKFHLSIMGCEVAVRATFDWDAIVKKARELEINATVTLVPRGEFDGSNYMKKVELAKDLPHRYTIKYDEDVLMGPQAWGFLFDNIDVLDDSKLLALFPALSNGVPTIDDFIESNLEPHEQKGVINSLSSVRLPEGLWGVDISNVNKILDGVGYDPETFYNEVYNVQSHYKGIHPIRIDWKTQKYLNDAILSNLSKFFEPRSFVIAQRDRPYFCNSFFAIRTDEWKKALEDKELQKDSFDEVQINLYREKYNLHNAVIINTFAIHCQYNDLFCEWHFDNQKSQFARRDELRLYENEFWQEVINKLVWSNG